MEINAIKKVFGEHAKKLAVSSTKSLHGHILGGTGAVEAVITILGLQNQVLPPTGNFIEPDPECDLDYVANEGRETRIDAALCNCIAFGSKNSALVFKRYDEGAAS